MEGTEPAARSLVDEVYAKIRSDIISVRYQPGAPLRVTQLAQETGASAIPVREALRRLQSEGLVEFTANRGARATTMSFEDLTDIYRTRRLLEGSALRLAHSHFDDTTLSTGLRLVEKMTDAFERGWLEEMERLHRQVHFTLYDAADSPWLPRLINVLWDNSGRYLAISPNLRDSPAIFGEEHERLLRIAAAKEVDEAVDALHSHLSLTESLMLANYGPTSSKLPLAIRTDQ